MLACDELVPTTRSRGLASFPSRPAASQSSQRLIALCALPPQAKPSMAHLSSEEAKQLTERIQNAGTEVVEAKVLCPPWQ